MMDENKTKNELTQELDQLRQQVANMENMESERRRAEEELHIKNIVFESSLSAISVADKDGVIHTVNPAFVQLWGYESKEEAIGNTVADFFVNQEDAAPILEALGGKGEWEGEFLAKKRDGSTFISRGLATAVFSDKGEMIGYQSTNLDITPQRKAEEELRKHRDTLEKLVEERASALRKSEERYRSLVVATSQIVWTTNAQGELIEDLPAWRAVTGQTEEEIKGSGWLDGIHPEDRDRATAIWKEAVEKGSLYDIEFRVQSHSGGYRHFWVRGVPIFESDGRIREWVGTCTDITDRRQSEDELKRLVIEQKLILDTVPATIWYKDLENRVIRVNKAAAESIGRSVEDIEGKSCYDLFPEEAEKYYRDDMEVVKSGQSKLGIVEQLQASSGEKIWVQTDKVLFRDNQGKVNGLIAFAVDITEQKRAEEIILKVNNELTAANKELEGFSYSVSHDLRAPLRAIHGFANILQEEYSNKLDSEGQRYLNVIATNTRQMGKLIDDILTLSRLGRKEIKTSQINMNDLAGTIFNEIKSLEPDRKLELNLKDIPPIQGDKALVRQALMNLISNSIKFTKPREIGIIEIGGNEEENEIVYYVKDNGVGFDMKYSNKLFGVFQRLHSTEDFEGTGIGLAIVQRVINRHGGRVWGEGKVDEGATFYFSLPKGDIL